MLKLSDLIKKTRDQILDTIAECATEGIHIIPPKEVILEVGITHSGGVADFNDVSVARAHLRIEIYSTPEEYLAALNAALETATDPFPKAEFTLVAAESPAAPATGKKK